VADRILTIDIETNGLMKDLVDFSSFPYKLLPTAKLWCVVVTDKITNQVWSAEKENITKDWLRKTLKGCTILNGHNILKFDLLMLQLFGVLEYRVGYLDETDTIFGEPVQIIDTLLLSRLLSPDRYDNGGGHSLKTWGIRLGDYKDDFRQRCIDAGYIEHTSPKGAEFLEWNPLILSYCQQDAAVTSKLFTYLWEQFNQYKGWAQAFKAETKIADKAIRRENLGFWLDRDLALENIAWLEIEMKRISDAINPILPPKPCNKTELERFTPPKTQLKTHKAVYLPKRQINKDGTLSATLIKWFNQHPEVIHEEQSEFFWFEETRYQLPYEEALVPEWTEPSENILKFAEQVGGRVENIDGVWTFFYKDRFYDLPFDEPLETEIAGVIDNIDHVKQYLIDLGWNPLELKQRDLTKDSKKQSIPYEKRLAALQRYVRETLEDGKYKDQRLEILMEDRIEINESNLFSVLAEKIKGNKPVYVPTSPCVRVGVEKELCPNLVKLGEKVAFVKDFSSYLTYKHRKNSIAGGVTEDFDYDEESPPTGYLAQYRESDGRIPTPAIEIGCNTTRYKHIGVANIPRVKSVFGEQMRAMFGSGKDFWEFGFDFSSLENCISGHYVIPFEGGAELAKAMIAAKPNDLHSLNAKKLGISRDDAKSFSYACLYGAQPAKLAKMLSISLNKAKQLYTDFWDGMPALKALKEKLERYWEKSGKQYILGLDGRRIYTRSKHSLLNAMFQSGGVIATKYTTLFMMQSFEEQGYCTDPFIGRPDICPMIEYHDEVQLLIRKGLVEIRNFETKELADQFIASWNGEQLSPSAEGKKGHYIAMPSPVSITIKESIQKAVETLKMRVNLGFEYKLHRTWAGCH
jgi:hypothetical protein